MPSQHNPRRGRPWRRFRKLVLQTYGPWCVICRQSIDLSLHWPDRWSYTVHHLDALVHGGALLDLDRSRPAHLTCNASQGARPHVTSTNTSCEW